MARPIRVVSDAARRLAEIIQRDVQERLGTDSSFEQRRDAAAGLTSDALWLDADQDLRAEITTGAEVEIDGCRYRRLKQRSSAIYFSRWGNHHIKEPIYRKVGVRNGPTIKPIELRAGIIKHMTPDMARIVGELTAHTGSRDVSTVLRVTGLAPLVSAAGDAAGCLGLYRDRPAILGAVDAGHRDVDVRGAVVPPIPGAHVGTSNRARRRMLAALIKAGHPAQATHGPGGWIDTTSTEEEAREVASRAGIGIASVVQSDGHGRSSSFTNLDEGGRGLGPVHDAVQRGLPVCTACLARPGDPCRTSSGRTCWPHAERELAHAKDAARALVDESQDEDLLGEIRDEIDRIGEVTSPERRIAIAQEIIEYVQLHYLEVFP